MKFLFEDLLVYQKAMIVAKLILRLTSGAPKGTASLVDQLRRASMSIPANLAEGCGRWHPNDRKQFFWIARGSVNECIVFIELGVTQNVLTEENQAELRNKLEEIGRMITGLIAATAKHTLKTST